MQNGHRAKRLLVRALGVTVILLTCLQLIEFFEAGAIQDAIAHVQKNALTGLRLVSRVAMDVAHEKEHERLLIARHISERDVSTMDRIAHAIETARKDYAETALEYSPLVTLPGEAVAWQRLTADIAYARVAADSALALSRANRDADASTTMVAAEPQFDAIDRDVSDLLNIIQRSADVAADEAHARHRIAALVQLLVTAGILAIVLIGGMWLTRAVVRIQRETEAFNRELENRNRELDAFAGRIAHDLRSPLNTITLSTELLASTPEAKTHGRMIRNGVARIARLIDDLLVLSRIGVMPRTVARTEPVATSLGEDLGRLVTEAHGVMHVNLEPAHVLCSEGLLRQALWNLGENAVKYCRPDAAPEIDIVGCIEGGHYAITVSDHGIGMSTDDARHAFEPFYRSPNVGSSIAGTGLGLAIVRRIIEASGGRIAIDSKLGHGTTFAITLPLAHAVDSAKYPDPVTSSARHDGAPSR